MYVSLLDDTIILSLSVTISTPEKRLFGARSVEVLKFINQFILSKLTNPESLLLNIKFRKNLKTIMSLCCDLKKYYS